MNLEQRIVGDIQGLFLIEAYQRGYRWAKDEIEHLLNDISEIPAGQSYCLQPVVVKEIEKNKYELIDGQQRLTTLYLIMKYLGNLIDLNYEIEYTTRKSENGHIGSRELLNRIHDIDITKPSSNIDELFIKKAYSIISAWFNADKKKTIDFVTKLQQYVTVIWYEVDKDEDSIEIFTRLNIGKISLTNAELVKALFLSKDRPGIDGKKQHEIALEWDRMEKDLHDPKFWAFITNAKAEKYPIRMEMLFDIIEKKPSQESDFYTFNSFSKRFNNSNDKYKTWETVVRNFQQLEEWYRDFDLFHQIGFLVARGVLIKDLLDIAMNDKTPITKTEFHKKVVEMIREKLVFKKGEGTPNVEEIDYTELNYEDHSDYIHTLLLLFNIETIRQKGDENTKFPFERYKSEGTWSLEHIHAQNSESLKTNDEWSSWLIDHKQALNDILRELQVNRRKEEEPSAEEKSFSTLISSIDAVLENINNINYKGSIRDEFNAIAPKIVSALSDGDDKSQMHTLSNMALLTVGENAALNNSTFDVKRKKIIEMDKNGDYIPVCTRNVFLKYYSESESKLHYWSEKDRIAYINAMNTVLYRKSSDVEPHKLIKTEIRYGNK